MTHTSESYGPRADRLSPATVVDLELGLMEVQQDNARLRQIVAELLAKNQALRWALQGNGMINGVDLPLVAPEEAA